MTNGTENNYCNRPCRLYHRRLDFLAGQKSQQKEITTNTTQRAGRNVRPHFILRRKLNESAKNRRKQSS